jgi:predicted aminopeptidase
MTTRTHITIATALGAIIAALTFVSTPSYAVDKPAPAARTLKVEAPAKVEDPTAALIRTERARLREMQAQRKAEREARAGERRRAELVRIRERIAALEARPAGGK